MLTAYIKLHRLIGAKIVKCEVFGAMRDCLVIPLDLNGIMNLDKKGLLWKLLLVPRKANKNNISHYLSVMYKDENMAKYIRNLGYYEQVKYLGNVFMSTRTNKLYKKGDSMDLDKALDII